MAPEQLNSMTPPAAAPAFLDSAGWGAARILPLAGDASFRRYFRVVEDLRTAVLMDAPPPHEDPRPFVAVAEWLTGHGFAAPNLLARDLEAGLVLLEDFGDIRMREFLDAAPQEEQVIYRRAVALLADLHRLPAARLPDYDREVYVREVSLLSEWYCAALDLEVDFAGYAKAWANVLPIAERDPVPPVTVLRDFHAENIMLLPDMNRSRGLGLLDFQDALAGHPAYDLVSLLQDARRDVSPALEAEMIARYKALARPQGDFDAAYAVLGAQRNAKIIGIFTRLAKRDGKPRYLSFLPRMWGLLERDLAHPALEPVARWFADNIPLDKRANAQFVSL